MQSSEAGSKTAAVVLCSPFERYSRAQMRHPSTLHACPVKPFWLPSMLTNVCRVNRLLYTSSWLLSPNAAHISTNQSVIVPQNSVLLSNLDCWLLTACISRTYFVFMIANGMQSLFSAAWAIQRPKHRAAHQEELQQHFAKQSLLTEITAQCSAEQCSISNVSNVCSLLIMQL